MSKLSQKALSLSTIAAMVAPMLMGALSSVDAAGVVLSVSPSTATISTATAPVVSFTAGADYASTDTLVFGFDAGYAVTAVDLTDATHTFAGPISCTVGASSASCLLTGETITTGDVISATFAATAPDTQASYAFSLVTSMSEYGAALQYVSNDNVVTVTANVTPSLSFNIRTLADDADINICDLETITTATLPNADTTDDGMGECGYSLAVGTNAQAGFQVMIASDFVMNNATADIANLASDDAAWVAGTEAYGLANVTAANTGRNEVSGLYDVTITEDGVFATDTSIVPQTATSFVSYTDGIQYTSGVSNNDVTQVMHGMTVGSGTPAGYYDQVVTYTVTANF